MCPRLPVCACLSLERVVTCVGNGGGLIRSAVRSGRQLLLRFWPDVTTSRGFIPPSRQGQWDTQGGMAGGSDATRCQLSETTRTLVSVQVWPLNVYEKAQELVVSGMSDVTVVLVEDDDRLIVASIMPTRGKWSPEQVEDSGEQLLLYSHLASENSPGKKIATRFLVLTKTEEPVIEEHVREVEPAAVKRTLAGAQRVWNAISAGNFYPASTTVSCSSRGYRAACRAWAG